jgi:hypothetical protein
MRQAIVTKYLGPTNFRGSRVKATCEADSITIPWDHAANVEKNHEIAAKALCVKLGWTWDFVGGALPRSNPGYAAWVSAPK